MAKRAKGPKPRRIPRRMCIACRESDGKRELIRLVRLADQVVLDETGKRAGRGAYVHPQISCWERALAGSLLQKALRTKIGAENLESLSASVSEASRFRFLVGAASGRSRTNETALWT